MRKRGKKLVLNVFLLGLAIVSLGLLGLYLDAKDRLGRQPAGPRLAGIKASPNFKDGKVINPEPTDNVWGLGDMWETLKDYRNDYKKVPDKPLPMDNLTRESFAEQPASGLRVVWLGHSSVLVEMDGAKILFDPVFADRASPFSLFGPKRFHPPPVSIEDLPDLDAVVISHDHYDHLDSEAVVRLEPKTAVFLVPLGVGAHLEAWGIPADKITELDWWDEAEVGGILFAACPARHFSGRSIGGNKTLWASFVAAGPEHRVFFSGDTGLAEVFQTVGERYGPFDVTFIKIGAYGRTWPDIHVDPHEAVILHEMVKGRLMTPIHWGTFNLSYHGWTEPAERVILEAEAKGVSLVVPRIGRMFEPSRPPKVERWWPDTRWRRTGR